MAAMATTLAQRSDAANSREFTAPTHTLAVPFIVKQKRTTPATSAGRATDLVTVIRGGNDVGGLPVVMPVQVRIEVTRQANMAVADVAACIALAREIVASTNFDALVSGQAYIQ